MATHHFNDDDVCGSCGCTRSFIGRFGHVCEGGKQGAAPRDAPAATPSVESRAQPSWVDSSDRCAKCGGPDPALYAMEYGWQALYEWESGGNYRFIRKEEQYLRLGDVVAPICDACISARRKKNRLLWNIAAVAAGAFVVGFVIWGSGLFDVPRPVSRDYQPTLFDDIRYYLANAPRRFGEFMDEHPWMSLAWFILSCVLGAGLAVKTLFKQVGTPYERAEIRQTGANMVWDLRKADIERQYANIDPHYDFHPNDKRVPYGTWEDFFEKRESGKRYRVHISKNAPDAEEFRYSIQNRNPRRLSASSGFRPED